MQMTVEKLQHTLEHFLANGVLTKESLISFAHPEQSDKSKFMSYPFDGERLAYVGSVPDNPAMFVMAGMTGPGSDKLKQPKTQPPRGSRNSGELQKEQHGHS
jgi:hypothetical protein